MSTDRLRIEQNQRVDISDFQFQSDESLNRLSEQTPGKMLTDPTGSRAWILDGFAIDNPVGNQIRVTKGRAVLSRREGSVITHGMVTTEGDLTKIIDVGSFSAVVHGIYVRFEYVDGDTLGRVFWDAASIAEFSQNSATRRKAQWSMRIEQTTPSAEWLKIGEVDLSIGPGSITDQRPLYFEGVVSTTYANTWGTGLGRDNDRQANGIKDLQTFTRAMRTLLEELRPSGARWWQARGLDVTGVLADETGVIGRGAATDGRGVEGFGAGAGAGGSFVGGATGYGGVLQADTTAPVRAALRTVPQDTDPSTALVGDHYTNTTTGKLRSRNNQEWERHRPQVTAFLDTDVEQITNTSGITPFAFNYSIPADTLAAGSIIDIFVMGDVLASAGGGDVTFEVRVGGVVVGTILAATLVSLPFISRVQLFVTSIGAGGDFSLASDTEYGTTQVLVSSSANALDTTAAQLIDVRVNMTVASASNTVELQSVRVDIS